MSEQCYCGYCEECLAHQALHERNAIATSPPPGASAGREPYLDTELLCPKCREPNTIGELRERHECKKCGHPSGNRRRASAGREPRELWEDAWDVLSAAHLGLFEYKYEPTDENFEALRAKIAEGRRLVADVLGTEIESLRSALAAERAAGEAAAVRIRELKAKLGHSDTDWAWDSDDVA